MEAPFKGRFHISYNRKKEYFSLIKEYLVKKINPNIFKAKFLEMKMADDDTTKIIEEDFEELSNFSIDLELEEGPFFLLINLL